MIISMPPLIEFRREFCDCSAFETYSSGTSMFYSMVFLVIPMDILLDFGFNYLILFHVVLVIEVDVHVDVGKLVRRVVSTHSR